MKKFLSIFALILTVFGLNNQAQAEEKNMANTKKLVVYFSKTGEQYSVGNISEGNTAIVAKMIAAQTGADLFEVKLKKDTYPAAYKALTEVALSEKKSGARPEIAGDVANFADYDVVFVGTPNWWADLPMAMYTFMEAHDWNGKKVAPFVTHEGSGLASIPNKIQTVTNAEMLSGLAVYGHIAQNSRDEAQKAVSAWLQQLGF
ncbi:MAG: flavodoxin [Alphaproteobacteria bacterium]|nr:flavodoxin [Alphaproteobacteria bacterium]